MATRMQQRRGTAAQWISTNSGNGPILEAGEIGFESDTGKFKIGDGTNHWLQLPYFADVDTLGVALDGDFVELVDIGAASGVAGLDASKNLLVPGASIIVEGATNNEFETTLTVTDPTADRTITFPNATGTVVLDTTVDEMAQDAVNTAIVAGTGLDKTYNDGDNTITLDIDSTVTTNSGSQTLTNKTIALGNNTVSGTTAEFNSALTDSNFVTTGDTGTVTSTMIADGTIVNADINASAAIDKTKISGTAITAADTGTVTSTMIADGTIVNADINASAGIALSKLSTDPLARANHTGSQTASTISDFDTQVRLSRLDQMTAPTASVSMNSQKITNLATPVDSTDAATKAYVDAVSEGLHIHASCVAATPANVNIATDLEAGDIVDGVTLVAGDRILVKSQTNAAQNGIYIVQASGAALRASDFNEPAEVDGGDFIFVTGGTLYDNTGWVQTTTNVVTIGTDPIVFTQFSGAGTYQAGTGLTLTGNTFSINTSTTVDTSTAQTLTNKTLTSPVINTPTGITKSDVGLGNVDNTSDANKPVSTATQTALDLKANLASPTFTGTVTLPTGTVTSAMILDGTIVNADINSSAAIAATKISGTAVTQADTGTVTNTMLAGSIANNKLSNSSITINGATVSLGGSTTISAAPTPQAVSSNITMQANYNYFVDTTAARTLTLPGSPALGDTIAIYDASGSAATNNITVSRNGNKINGVTDDALIDVNQAVAMLVYTGTTLGWKFD